MERPFAGCRWNVQPGDDERRQYYAITAAGRQAATAELQRISAPIDLADGYIHFSTPSQVAETAAKWFATESDLVLVAVDPDRLGPALKWEPSRGGQLFPHLYRALRLDELLRVKALPTSLSLPWGLNTGAVGMLPYLPLPSKLHTRVLAATTT